MYNLIKIFKAELIKITVFFSVYLLAVCYITFANNKNTEMLFNYVFNLIKF